jgi:hypothetical protein
MNDVGMEEITHVTLLFASLLLSQHYWCKFQENAMVYGPDTRHKIEKQ